VAGATGIHCDGPPGRGYASGTALASWYFLARGRVLIASKRTRPLARLGYEEKIKIRAANAAWVNLAAETLEDTRAGRPCHKVCATT
jgi:hypothetical protein